METLTVQNIFNLSALDILSERLKTAATAKDFFAEVDEIASNPELLLPLPAPIEFPFQLNSEKAGDSGSAITLLEAVGPLNPADAADPRLWSYLALVTLRSYMESRWPVEGEEKWQNKVKERWLLGKPSRRRLIRHGISRLWWVASLTHDADLEYQASRESNDEFAYVKWAFENQNRIQSIFERQLGSNKRVRWALLEAMQKSKAKDQSKEIKRITKEMNLESGFRQLDVLDSDELEALIRVEA